MRNGINLVLVLLVALLVSGCETVKGMATDLENTGNNLLDFIDRVENKNN